MAMELPITDPVLIFALAMLLILVAPLLFTRMRLPGVVGLIVAGALVGPSAANLLARDQTIELLGAVGLLYLMFVAGLSLEIDQFIRHRSHSLVFGLLAFGIPQGLGVAAGLVLLDYDWPTAILLGSIIGSHTLLAYPIAQRLGITRNPAVTAAIGSSLVTDGLALVTLAGVIGVHGGHAGVGFWLRFAAMVGVYVAVVTLALPRLGRWFFRTVAGDANTDYLFLLAVLFGSAYAAGLVGLEPIIGAFLVGLALNRLVPDTGALMTRVRFVGDALFIPFFLLSVGMLVDFRVLVSSPGVWYAAGLFIAGALAGKVAAAKISQWLFGYTPQEGWAVAGLTIPQAAATLAVTLVGFEAGLFDAAAVNAVVILILVTCVVGPWMLERFGRAVALKDDSRPHITDAPRRVLVPLANPGAAEAMMDVAFMIRPKNSDEPVYPLTVALEGPGVEGRVAAGERMLGNAVIHAAAAEVPVIPVTRADVNIAQGVIRAQRDLRVSTVVIGWSGGSMGLGRVFGSVVDQVVAGSAPQVVICRFVGPVNTMRRVMLSIPPFAEREIGFEDSIRTTKRLAQQMGAKLSITARPSDLARLDKRLAAIGPAAPTALVPAESAFEAMARQSPPPGPTDALVMLSARSRRISWHPGLDRLPRQFVGRFPDVNLIAIYPSEVAPDPAAPAPGGAVANAGLPSRLLHEDRVLVGIDESEPAGVASVLMAPHFGDRPAVLRRVLSALHPTSQSVPIEVAPGVVLMHAHTPQVDKPTLFLGTLRHGQAFPRVSNRVFLVFVLLSPRDLPPREHLESLAGIAHLVHAPAVVRDIHDADSPREVLEAMTRHA